MVPNHPFLAHIPLVLALFLPLVLGIIVVLVTKKKLPISSWWIAVSMQLLVVVFAYVALSTGEAEEDLVRQFVHKSFIGKHENIAEMFAGASVILLGLMMVALFVKENLAKHLRMVTCVLSLLPLGIGLYAGRLGGEIAYAHGGAEAYYASTDEEETGPMGILPTPGVNTSESEFPMNELELNNPDSDFEDFERENGGDPNEIEAIPLDQDLFPEDEEDSSN